MINEIDEDDNKKIFEGCFFCKDVINFGFIRKEKEENDNKNENNDIFERGRYMEHVN